MDTRLIRMADVGLFEEVGMLGMCMIEPLPSNRDGLKDCVHCELVGWSITETVHWWVHWDSWM